MNELLGFIVLSGPLFLIVIFAVVAIIITLILRKKVTGTKKRLLGGLSVFGIALFLLFGDEMIGKMYLGYLCENKTEQVMHNQIKLPADYWNEDGSLKFTILKNGMANFNELRKWYIVEYHDEKYIDFYISITKTNSIYFDPLTKQKIAVETSFSRHYGWLNNFSPAPNIGESCRNVLIRKYGKNKYSIIRNNDSQNFMNEIFTKY